MRPHKLLIVTATMIASTTLAGLANADDTTSSAPVTTGASATPSGASGSTSVQSSTVMTPSSPSVPTTSTTITTQGTPGSTSLPPSTPPTTSTTTTTSADDYTGTPPAPVSTSPEPRESTTIYRHDRPNVPLLVTGASLFVSTYVTTAAIVGANGSVGDHDLYIPIVGPWINIADRNCPGDCPNETRDQALIIGSGVLQGVGAGLLLSSFLIPEKVPAARISAGPVKMVVAPAGPGVSALGTF